NFNLLIGEHSAEKIKIELGDVIPEEPYKEMEIKGRDLVSGVPKTITINSSEVRSAITEQIDTIVDTVKSVLEQTPPELAADIVDKGIVLTGGVALLKNLDKLLREQTDLPIIIADDPLSSVVLGSGMALDNLDILKEVMVH
ncbi:MAG: rod shape-determining protein, partial [Thermodesulfobacteriota bacterium]